MKIAKYTYMIKNIILLLLLLFAYVELDAFPHNPWKLDGADERIKKHRMGDSSIKILMPNGQIIPEGTKFKIKQIKHAFQFGGSLAADWKVPERKWYPDFKRQFANLFNYATIDFYWAVHSHRQGEWTYEPTSREKLDWAKDQGMKLRGHPLMWHEVVPEWISSSTRDIKKIDRDIMSHIEMLVEEYPEIDEWDLYNETPGIRLHKSDMGVRRWVEWSGGVGPVTEKIVDAVRSIRPDGRFILNHFTDDDPEYHDQIAYCLSNDVPVDVIGIQTHMHHLQDAIPEDRLWNALNEYQKYGKPLQLSEITILSCEMFPEWSSAHEWYDEVEAAKQAGKPALSKPSLPEWELYQAALAKDFYTLSFSHPAVEAIIWWTITDVEPWRGMPAGLLDEQGKPKPIYHTLDKLINQDWKTNIEGRVTKEGKINFRGFYGTYSIELQYGDKVWEGIFEKDKRNQDALIVKLKNKD